MKRWDLDRYLQFTADAERLAVDPHGDKVLRKSDGTIIKLFRRKRFFSSAGIVPYATRFERNARMLKRQGFRTVEVQSVFRVPRIKRDVVAYPEIEGETFRDYVNRPQLPAQARLQSFEKLSYLLAELHRNGILFRSIHFGNVLVMPDSELALIDISDLRKQLLPLSSRQRARNFRHMLRYAEDRAALREFGAEKFVEHYLRAANFMFAASLKQRLDRLLPAILSG